MEEHCKSLALQYDLFVNSTLKFLDASIERDYMLKLKIIDELTYKISESEADKKTIKETLETIQDECSKLTFKLKTSARLLDEVRLEKEKLEIEKQTMKSQLDQLYNVLKQPGGSKLSEVCLPHNNHLDSVQPNEVKTLNSTDALLSDLSYSQSENSSYENVIKKSKPNSAPIVKNSGNNDVRDINTKISEIKNMNINGGQIIATTTLTMDQGFVNAKSVIQTQPTSTSKASLKSSSSVESLSSDESEDNFKNCNNFNVEKKHNFVEKIVVIPETCCQCQKKIKFNNLMVKCLDCKIIGHLECKNLLPTKCILHQTLIDALNCGVPLLVVHCISEIERRGLNTIGLYRVSGSDKEVKKLKEKFRKSVPNLNDVDVHVLCSCIKDSVRMQKNRLICESNFSKMADALKKNEETSKSLSQIVLELPSVSRSTLAFLILHLQNVANSPKCCMDFNCLAIVFAPTIVGLSSTSLNDLHIKSEVIIKVVTELLKLPKSFWISLIKINSSSSSDEQLFSTPIGVHQLGQPQSSGSSHRFFSSGGLRRRILDSPKKCKIAKKVEFEEKIESSE